MLSKLNQYTLAIGMADLPSRLQEQWSAFIPASEHILSQPLYVKEEMLSLMNDLQLCSELRAVILEQTRVIEDSEELSTIAKFLKWALYVDMPPWRNDIYDIKPDVKIMKEYKGVFILIVMFAGMISSLKQARERGIPEDYLVNPLKHFSNAVNNFYKRNNAWGLDNISWNLLTTSFTLFKIDNYSFNINYYNGSSELYRNEITGEAVLLTLPGYEYNSFGERVSYNRADRPARDEGFISTLIENDEFIEGNYIYPIGYASREVIRLDKAVWKRLVYPGSTTLAFHIPTGIDYTVESVKADFKKALKFYTEYFAEMKFAAFSCDSWLFSPQLQLIFDESESKIVRMQRETYLQAPMSDDGSFVMFVFGQKIDVSTSPRDTTLKRRILEFIEKGGQIRGGEMLLPIEDYEQQRPYFKSEHLDKVKQLYQNLGII